MKKALVLSMLLGLSITTSTAHADALSDSDHQMMYRVVDGMSLSSEIIDFISKSKDKRFVFSNIESDTYTDETSPEYIIQDVLYDSDIFQRV